MKFCNLNETGMTVRCAHLSEYVEIDTNIEAV